MAGIEADQRHQRQQHQPFAAHPAPGIQIPVHRSERTAVQHRPGGGDRHGQPASPDLQPGLQAAIQLDA